MCSYGDQKDRKRMMCSDDRDTQVCPLKAKVLSGKNDFTIVFNRWLALVLILVKNVKPQSKRIRLYLGEEWGMKRVKISNTCPRSRFGTDHASPVQVETVVSVNAFICYALILFRLIALG